MNEKYNILIAEDMPDDAALARYELGRVLKQFKVRVVDTEAGFLHALDAFKPDLIISDFKMPAFDGLTALKLTMQISPHTPVIILTGSMNEDTAVECMKAGAADYVIKEHIKRLGQAVINALDQKKIRFEKSKAIEALKQSEERFRMIFEKSELGITLQANDLTFLKANSAFCSMVGYSEKELTKMSFSQITAVEDIEENKKSAAALWNGTISSYRTEKRYYHKDGSIIWVFIAVTVIRNNLGDPRYYLTMVNNITERKSTEEKLVQERILLRTLIDNLPHTIYVKDTEKRKILANQADLELIGKSEFEVIGKTDREVFPLAEAESFEADDDHVLTKGEAVLDREEMIVNPEGQGIWLLTSKVPLYNQDGKITGLIGIGHDITKRKLAENELKESEIKLKKQNEEYLRLNQVYIVVNEELTESLERIQRINSDLQISKNRAEESDRLKTAFLHNISHEIRTPLNAIVGFSSILSNPDLSVDKKKEFIDIISVSNDQLLSIITGIIALATLEAGQEQITEMETDINLILLNVYEQFLTSRISAEVTFSYHPALPDELALVYTDPVKLMQILVNLVGNALKFTHKGKVRFGYKLIRNRLKFFVEDTGIGIPVEMHEHIFERFRQVDNSATRKYGGTGLGLALSKGYVELLGGSLKLTSQSGKGSLFSFSLPYIPVIKTGKVVNANSKVTKTMLSPGKIILVAEDETNNFLLINELLTNMKLKVIRAENGLEAVNKCLSGNLPDLILMDIKMPVMDGIEATKRIKKFSPGLPIVALTAYALEVDKKRIFESGCDDYIEKPIQRKVLFETLIKHLTN